MWVTSLNDIFDGFAAFSGRGSPGEYTFSAEPNVTISIGSKDDFIISFGGNNEVAFPDGFDDGLGEVVPAEPAVLTLTDFRCLCDDRELPEQGENGIVAISITLVDSEGSTTKTFEFDTTDQGPDSEGDPILKNGLDFRNELDAFLADAEDGFGGRLTAEYDPAVGLTLTSQETGGDVSITVGEFEILFGANTPNQTLGLALETFDYDDETILSFVSKEEGPDTLSLSARLDFEGEFQTAVLQFSAANGHYDVNDGPSTLSVTLTDPEGESSVTISVEMVDGEASGSVLALKEEIERLLALDDGEDVDFPDAEGLRALISGVDFDGENDTSLVFTAAAPGKQLFTVEAAIADRGAITQVTELDLTGIKPDTYFFAGEGGQISVTLAGETIVADFGDALDTTIDNLLAAIAAANDVEGSIEGLLASATRDGDKIVLTAAEPGADPIEATDLKISSIDEEASVKQQVFIRINDSYLSSAQVGDVYTLTFTDTLVFVYTVQEGDGLEEVRDGIVAALESSDLIETVVVSGEFSGQQFLITAREFGPAIPGDPEEDYRLERERESVTSDAGPNFSSSEQVGGEVRYDGEVEAGSIADAVTGADDDLADLDVLVPSDDNPELFGSEPGFYTEDGLFTPFLNGGTEAEGQIDGEGNLLYTARGEDDLTSVIDIEDDEEGAAPDNTALEGGDIVKDDAGVDPFTWGDGENEAEVISLFSGNAAPDVIHNFQVENDRIALEGDLLDSTFAFDGEGEGVGDRIEVVASSQIGLGEDGNSEGVPTFDLSLIEFGLIRSADNSTDSAEDLADAESVASLLGNVFEFSASENGALNTTIFAITALDDDSVTAIWAHQQSSQDDATIEAAELFKLATVNTIDGEFSVNNFAGVEEILHQNLL